MKGPLRLSKLASRSCTGKMSLDASIQHHRVNPFTPKSDQFQISPPASPEVFHHTVGRTWLFTAYSDER